jgi:DNA-binding transcriptional ArsR family regulator
MGGMKPEAGPPAADGARTGCKHLPTKDARANHAHEPPAHVRESASAPPNAAREAKKALHCRSQRKKLSPFPCKSRPGPNSRRQIAASGAYGLPGIYAQRKADSKLLKHIAFGFATAIYRKASNSLWALRGPMHFSRHGRSVHPLYRRQANAYSNLEAGKGADRMAYSELIKDVSRIRGYMREFFVYGFKTRDEVGLKSARSYDNEKRRIESWLAGYMSFRQDAGGKAVFLSVDSRHTPHNPLYKAWKAASFTKNDISLHFALLDILADGKPRSLSELLAAIDVEYLPSFAYQGLIDESTLRKKLKEYTENGLLCVSRQGKQHLYSLSGDSFDLQPWRGAVQFFSEGGPLGVVGSFVLDKYEGQPPRLFSFKHRYLLFALDSGILMDLLNAIHARQRIELELTGRQGGRRQAAAVPLKICVSTQGGRQYLAAYSIWSKKIAFFRLDAITKVKPLEAEAEFSSFLELFKSEQPHIWGVSCAQHRLEHIEMTLALGPQDAHVIRRLEREKRCGSVAQTSESEWRFAADVYDAGEMMPWLRTFIGRISSLACSNKHVEQQFWSDCRALAQMYEGEGNAV